MTSELIDIYTDGACKGNPGPGGWGAILRMGPHEKELSGSDPQTTNTRRGDQAHRRTEGHRRTRFLPVQ